VGNVLCTGVHDLGELFFEGEKTVMPITVLTAVKNGEFKLSRIIEGEITSYLYLQFLSKLL